MEKFEVTILGCGSALPTLKHGNTSQIISIRNKLFMVDCGEGTQLALRRYSFNFNRITTILISHLHGDHCLGLHGLISTMGLLGRKAPLHVYGPEDTERVFRPMIDYFCAGLEYEVVFHVVDTTRHELIYEDHSLTIHTIPLKHRIPCCGYLFKEKEGQRHIIPGMIERYDIPFSQVNNIKAGHDYTSPDGTIIKNSVLTSAPTPVRSYAFCSDTAYSKEIIPIIKGVDMLYHESTYGEDRADLAKKYNHSTTLQAAKIAKAAKVGRLILGHYSQRYNNETPLLEEAKQEFCYTELADEGKVFSI